MIRYFLLLASVLQVYGIVCTPAPQPDEAGERHIAIVTPSYNNKQWHKWNIDSVINQKYSNWHMYIVDDCSPDDTGALCQEYVTQRGFEDKITVIQNKTRVKALANLYNTIHLCDPRSIVAIVDGDDALAHDGVLEHLNTVYSNSNVWLTYGQYQEWPSGEKGFCRPMPKWVVKRSSYRYYTHGPSHLRTFYAGLFHNIKKEDLMHEGDFFAMTYDLAIMYPMMEMAAERFAFIPEVLLDYNTINPISDHRVSQDLQRSLDQVIRQKRPYARLNYLFEK